MKTTFTVIFLYGTLVFTNEQFRNRLDVYNYVCRELLTRKYGKLIAIRED